MLAIVSLLRTITPIQEASAAFKRPTTINGAKALANAAGQLKLAAILSQAVPNNSVINIPIVLAIIAWVNLKAVFSRYQPMKRLSE